jgi:hypothetical protein
MKDKRTYTNLKEHGEDMTHENESKVDPKEDRGGKGPWSFTQENFFSFLVPWFKNHEACCLWLEA